MKSRKRYSTRFSQRNLLSKSQEPKKNNSLPTTNHENRVSFMIDKVKNAIVPTLSTWPKDVEQLLVQYVERDIKKLSNDDLISLTADKKTLSVWRKEKLTAQD